MGATIVPICIIASVFRAIFPNTLPREQGVYWIIWSLEIISFAIVPFVSEYQEIHTYSAMNIDTLHLSE